MDREDIEDINKDLDKKLMFTSPNCGGCHELKQDFKRLHVDTKSIEEININDEKHSKLVEKYKIKHVPSIILIDKEKKVIEDDFEECVDYLVSSVD